MKNRFFLHCAVTVIVSVTATLYSSLLLLIFTLLYFIYLYNLFPKKYTLYLMVIMLVFYGNTTYHVKTNQTHLTGSETEIIIQFTKPAKLDGNKLSGLVKVSGGERVWLTYYLHSPTEARFLANQLYSGNKAFVTGSLQKPIGATVENAFDFKKYLYHEQAHWILQAKTLEFKEERTVNFFYRAIQVREKGINRVKNLFEEPTRSFALALLFGDQGLVTPEQYQDYRTLGIVHLLAISGMQVALLCAFFFYSCIRIGMTRERTNQLLLIVIPCYGVLTGMSPSVLRACGMALIYVGGRLFKKNISPFHAVITCLIVFVFCQPYIILSPGFQLSFNISFGLILSQNILAKANVNTILQPLIITSICQVVSLPIMLYFFYEVPGVGLIANLFYIPLYSFVLLPLVSLAFLASFLPISIPIQIPLNYLFKMLVLVTDMLADVPFGTIRFGKPSLLIVVFLIVTSYFVFIGFEKGCKRMIKNGLLLLLFICLYQYNHHMFIDKGEVTFIDIGQGDAVLIRLPRNKAIYLIDTGGILMFNQNDWEQRIDSFEPGKDILVPILASKGIRNIDKLILSHADQDHVGGGEALMQNVDIKEVVVPIGQRKEFVRKGVISEALSRKIPIKEVLSGSKWSVGEATFEVLSPNKPIQDTNDSSIVLMARINNLSWLFTGDLGQEGELELMRMYPNLKTDVLKVGHHGSKTSSSEQFIKAIQAKAAIISVGRKNSYGHPHREVVTRLTAHKINIFRTDLQGSITYRFNSNHDGTFSTQAP